MTLGFPDGTFQPKKPMTRAEFVTLFNRLLNRGPLLGRQVRWPDVTAAYWAFGDVQEASTSHKYEMGPQGERWVEDLQ